MFIKRKANPELEPTRIPTAIDIAWAAGVYEGEGSCRGHQKRSILAQMCQKDPEVLYRLKELFGGSVAEYANPGSTKQGMIFKWTVSGDKARILFALIYPFLTARRKSQVDRSNALVFMNGQSSDGCSREQILGELTKYYEQQEKTLLRAMTEEQRKAYWRGVANRYRARKGMKPNVRLHEKREAERQAKVIPIAQGKVS